MTKEDIDKMVAKYADEELGSDLSWLNHSTQFDDRSARINYSFVRERKPKVVVEFGSRTGRCTHDILKALLKNGGDFVFKPYELEEDLRAAGQQEINRIFQDKAVIIGGDITKANDLPDNIDYLFVDNYHDWDTTKWVFEVLLKKCTQDVLIQIHDIKFKGDWDVPKVGEFPESYYLFEKYNEGTLPIKKLYWSYEFEDPVESSWWVRI